MIDPTTPAGAARHQEEFAALRATIRERGTARMVLFPICIAVWAGAAIATTAAVGLPIAALAPLVVLAAGFEAIFALHVNVERIGRYLQIFHEDGAGWEHASMQYAERFGRGVGDGLFSGIFLSATALNYLPVALGGDQYELVVAGALHLLLGVHIGTSRRRVRRQRTRDLERYQAIKSASPPA
jgi:hypothetical protein